MVIFLDFIRDFLCFFSTFLLGSFYSFLLLEELTDLVVSCSGLDSGSEFKWSFLVRFHDKAT